MKKLIATLVLSATWSSAQKPEIFPGGVVNAASYATGGYSGKGVSAHSIVSIFGSNLATGRHTAEAFPLPTTLGGTTVTVDGVAAPLFYISPHQINIQYPGGNRLVVTTPAGSGDPVELDNGGEVFGIFTLDGSGCGRAAVLNVAADGRTSLNSPENSASPGDYISVYGTGLVGFSFWPPLGSPAPSDPPPLALGWSLYTGVFDFAPLSPATPLRSDVSFRERVSWAGRAPGFVGVDQVNLRIPETVREGCGVPLIITNAWGRSQPVPISIRRGGGVCADPPERAYGEILWERSWARGIVTETFTAAFPASPGKIAPPSPFQRPSSLEFFGPACGLPGYRNLNAGTVVIEGPGFGPTVAGEADVVAQPNYRTVLPEGTIRAGSFTVRSGGEKSEVGPLESHVHIGSGIEITSSFPPGTVLTNYMFGGRDLTVNWTGGDPDAWVTVILVSHLGSYDSYGSTRVRASAGTASLAVAVQPARDGRGEIIVEVTPDPDQVPALAAPGLSLGGRHLWKYTYRFGGLTIQ